MTIVIILGPAYILYFQDINLDIAAPSDTDFRGEHSWAASQTSPGRGHIDQIFTIRQLLTLRHTHRRSTVVILLYLNGTLESVYWASLFNVFH